jgi:hypothetical protein
MTRVVGVLALGMLVVGTVRADVAPPKGLKRVVLDNKITTEKEYADLAFFLVSGGDKVEPVKLDPKTPLVIEGAGRGGRFRFVQVVAVPKDAAKNYDGEKAFHAAIAAGKVAGLVKSKGGFSTLTAIKDTDTRKTVVEEYKLEKIDPKEGLVFTAAKPPAPGSAPPKDGGKEEDETAYTPKAGLWIAGVAATAALVFAGIWLAGRGRRA